MTPMERRTSSAFLTTSKPLMMAVPSGSPEVAFGAASERAQTPGADPYAGENLSRNALAFLQLASIRLMLRKLCNPA